MPKNHFSSLRLSSGRFLLLVLGLFCVVGCGSGSGPDAKSMISGKITVEGQPANGTVHFIGPDGTEKMGIINMLDGTYTVLDPVPGDNKIAVKSMQVAGGAATTPPPDMKTGGPKQPTAVAPPTKYASPDNGLTHKVTTDKKQTYNVDLKQ